MDYRTARANWTPINWGEFCKQTLVDANKEYRDQLVREGTLDDLDVLVADLNERLRKNTREYSEINAQLTEALKQRDQRRQSRG